MTQKMVGVGDGRLAAETTPITGDTTNDYVVAYTENLQWAADTTLVIANTDASNNMTYDVRVYSNNASGKPYTVTSNTVAFGDADEVILARHSKVEVRVKSASSGLHATYQIDSLAGRS
jgi:uncharacterized membrane protein YfhO